MLSWFQALMPREERFFDLFEHHAETLVAGAEALRTLLEGGDHVLPASQELRKQEHAADEITREVLLAVRRTFITPFDRSDITELITAMDDAIDQMHQTGKAALLYETRHFEPQMQGIGGIVILAADVTRKAVPLLRAMKKNAAPLTAYAEEITRLENEADALHDQGLKSLYERHRNADPMGYIVGAELYGHLEKVVDGFEQVAGRVTDIVIEHS